MSYCQRTLLADVEFVPLAGNNSPTVESRQSQLNLYLVRASLVFLVGFTAEIGAFAHARPNRWEPNKYVKCLLRGTPL